MDLRILYLILYFGIFIYWLWRKWTTKKTLPPELSGKLPIIGHAHKLIGDSKHAWKVFKWIGEESVRQGGVITFSIGFSKLYAIADPTDCATIANTCLRKHHYYSYAIPWLGDGLLTSSVAVWKVHRKILGHAFNQPMLNGFIQVFNEKSRQLVEQLTVEVDQGAFDMNQYLAMNNLEIICKTALGIDKAEDQIIFDKYEIALGQILNILTERFQKFWLHSNFVYNRTKLKKYENDVVKDLHDMSNKALLKRKLILKDNNNHTDAKEADNLRTFMDIILSLAEANSSFNDTNVRELVDNIIFAGHDTISRVLTFALVLIGSYPNVQEQAYNEICEVFRHTDRDVDKDDWIKLPYLEAVLKETMRIYPVGPVVARYSEFDVKLKNYTIPAGSSCILLFCGLHQHSIWGADADKFRPERWLHPFDLPQEANAFAGFSIGRRNCIGQVYAMMSMKTTLVHLLRQYKVTADVTNLEVKLEAMLKPVEGHHIYIERRVKH